MATRSVRPYDGLWLDNYQEKGIDYRIFGIAWDGERCQRVAWWDSVVARHQDGGIYPLGHNVLIQREQKTDLLTPKPLYKSTARVVEVGEAVRSIAIFDRVVFALEQEDDMLTLNLPGWEDFAIIPESAILAILDQIPGRDAPDTHRRAGDHTREGTDGRP